MDAFYARILTPPVKRIAILALAVLPLFASADVLVPEKDRLEPADTTTTATSTTTNATTTNATTTATQASAPAVPPAPAPQKKTNPAAFWMPIGVILMVVLIARRNKRLQSGG